jgi:hypothetical protein
MSEPFIEDDMARAKRGISWVRLEEALGGTGCPVCTQIERTEKHYLEGLLSEYVLDVGVRKKLHRQHGLCTRHGKLALMAEVSLGSDGLHLATMFETVLEENIALLGQQGKLIEEIAAETNRRKKRRNIRSVDSSTCFECDFLKNIEEITLHNLLYLSNDDELIAEYKNSKTLICFRHIQMLVKEKVSARLLYASMEKVNKVKSDVSNFIMKHDYQSAHDYTRDELDSYLDAVNFFSGQMRW